MEVLCSPNNKEFNKGLVIHGLPVILGKMPESLPGLVTSITNKLHNNTDSLQSILSVLKVARKMKLITSENLPNILTGIVFLVCFSLNVPRECLDSIPH